MAELTCISADSHVVEPGNLFLDYIAPAYRDRAPRVVQEDDRDIYMCEGMRLISMRGRRARDGPVRSWASRAARMKCPAGRGTRRRA